MPSGRVVEDLVQRVAPRLGTHEHARPPAVRRVVDGPVPVGRPVAQVVDAQVEPALVDGPADQREPQRGQVVREDRDDVDPHLTGSPSGSDSRPGGRVDEHDAAGRGRLSGTIAATKGTRTSAPVRAADREHVLAGQVQDLDELADRLTGDGAHRSPTSWESWNSFGSSSRSSGSTSATSSTPRRPSAAPRSA